MDSISVFAEGTFEEQLQELLEYATRGIPDEERTALAQTLKDTVKTDNASPDQDRRRTAFELVLKNIKSVGQGTDHGACGHDRSRLPLKLPQKSRDSSISSTRIYLLCGKWTHRKRDSM